MQLRSKSGMKQCWSVVSTVADTSSDQRLCLGPSGFTDQLLRSSQFHMCSCPLIVLGNFSISGSRLLSLSVGSPRTANSLQTTPLLSTVSLGAVISSPPVFSSAADGAVVSTMESLLQPAGLAVQGLSPQMLVLIMQIVQSTGSRYGTSTYRNCFEDFESTKFLGGLL